MGKDDAQCHGRHRTACQTSGQNRQQSPEAGEQHGRHADANDATEETMCRHRCEQRCQDEQDADEDFWLANRQDRAEGRPGKPRGIRSRHARNSGEPPVPGTGQPMWSRSQPRRGHTSRPVEAPAGDKPAEHHEPDHHDVRVDDEAMVTGGEIVAGEIVDRRSVLVSPRMHPVGEVPGVTVDGSSPHTASAGQQTLGVLQIVGIALSVEFLQPLGHLAGD